MSTIVMRARQGMLSKLTLLAVFSFTKRTISNSVHISRIGARVTSETALTVPGDEGINFLGKWKLMQAFTGPELGGYPLPSDVVVTATVIPSSSNKTNYTLSIQVSSTVKSEIKVISKDEGAFDIQTEWVSGVALTDLLALEVFLWSTFPTLDKIFVNDELILSGDTVEFIWVRDTSTLHPEEKNLDVYDDEFLGDWKLKEAFAGPELGGFPLPSQADVFLNMKASNNEGSNYSVSVTATNNIDTQITVIDGESVRIEAWNLTNTTLKSLYEFISQALPTFYRMSVYEGFILTGETAELISEKMVKWLYDELSSANKTASSDARKVMSHRPFGFKVSFVPFISILWLFIM